MKKQNKMSLIGVVGRAGSGKDTAGLLLQSMIYDECGHYIPIGKFAEPIKKLIADATGLEWEDIENRKFKDSEMDRFWHLFEDFNGNKHSYWGKPSQELIANIEKPTGRDLMIHIGNAIREKIPDFWINIYRNSYPRMSICTDLRYDNEGNFIKGIGGLTVKLERDVPNSGDISENGFTQEPDFIIDNNGSLEDLRNSLKPICNAFVKKFDLI